MAYKMGEEALLLETSFTQENEFIDSLLKDEMPEYEWDVDELQEDEWGDSAIEAIGYAAIQDGIEGAPAALRRRLMACALSPAFRENSLLSDLAEDLRALDHGEVRPVLAPAQTGQHGKGYTLAKMRLAAVGCVEFLNASGMKKKNALDIVSRSYGCSTEAITSWSKRLPNILGQEVVDNCTDFAKFLGSAKLGDDRYRFGRILYSDEQIAASGRAYLDAVGHAAVPSEKSGAN